MYNNLNSFLKSISQRKPLSQIMFGGKAIDRIMNKNNKNIDSYAHISMHISADFGQGDLHSVSTSSSIAC
jgi:hypothetical protein